MPYSQFKTISSVKTAFDLTVVEAKKTDLKTGFGQCIAEMVAAVVVT